MSYDEKMAGRIRAVLMRRADRLSERKMFGGLCFMVNEAMCCGLTDVALMLRVGPEQYEAALAQPHARPMDFTGRPLKGFVYVDAPGVKTDAALARWADRALAYVTALPPRKKRAPKKPSRTFGRKRTAVRR